MNGIYGRAATGLQDASWAKNAEVARIGATGETRTASELAVFGNQAAVFHDLRVPIPGFKSNIDHIVVTGKKVLLIDTKVWKPGIYWTLFGSSRRGLERVKHVDKGQDWLIRAMETFLAGTGAKVSKVNIAVWPSGAGNVNTAFLKIPGVNVMPAAEIRRFVERNLTPGPSDDVITTRLRTLVTGPPLRRAAGSDIF